MQSLDTLLEKYNTNLEELGQFNLTLEAVNKFEKLFIDYKSPCQYIGIFGITGDYEKLATVFCPEDTIHTITYGNDADPKEIDKYCKLVESRNQQVKLLQHYDIFSLDDYIISDRPVFLNLDVYSLSASVPGNYKKIIVESLLEYKKRNPNFTIRMISYTRGITPHSNVIEVARAIFNQERILSIETNPGRYGKSKPTYFTFTEDQ